MAYNKNNWVDRDDPSDDDYLVDGVRKTIIKYDGDVITLGTTIDAAKLNNIEEGIKGAHLDIAEIINLLNNRLAIRENITLSSDSSTLDIEYFDFDANDDTILIWQNGTFIQENEDYTISTNQVNKNSGTWASGTIFNFLIFKQRKALSVDDSSESPGSKYIVRGDSTSGFFDIVQSEDFIDGDTLASDLGLTGGASYKPNSPWIKVSIDGQVAFFPMLPLRRSISWDHIYNVGAVHGDGSIGTLPPEGRLGTELEITDGTTITTAGHFLGDKSSGTDYYDAVGAVGDTIVLDGWDNAANNGEFTIDTITDTAITVVEGGLVAEVGDRDSKLWPKANEVIQNAEVTIDGLVYQVRLFKGFDEDPMNSYADSDRGAVGSGSEWNRIVLPLHERATAQNWNYTQYAGTTEDWDVDLSDEDMILHYDFGSGSRRWCQEVRDDDATFRRGYRGYDGASDAYARLSWTTTSHFGWCPVLILKKS